MRVALIYTLGPHSYAAITPPGADTTEHIAHRCRDYMRQLSEELDSVSLQLRLSTQVRVLEVLLLVMCALHGIYVATAGLLVIADGLFCQNHKFSEIADQSVLEVGAWERGHLLSRRRARLQPQAWSCFVSATTLRLLLPAPHYPVSAVLLFRLGVDLHTSMSSLGALDRVPTRRAATQLARQKQGADESSSAPYAHLIPGKEGTVVGWRCTLAATILFDSI